MVEQMGQKTDMSHSDKEDIVEDSHKNNARTRTCSGGPKACRLTEGCSSTELARPAIPSSSSVTERWLRKLKRGYTSTVHDAKASMQQIGRACLVLVWDMTVCAEKRLVA